LHGTKLTAVGKLKNIRLEQVLYMAFYNDVSYLVDNRIIFDISIYNYPDLIKEFNEETNNAKDMSKFTDFLEKIVENIVGKEEEKGIESLFSFDKTTLNKSVQNMDDFELVSFLVIK